MVFTAIASDFELRAKPNNSTSFFSPNYRFLDVLQIAVEFHCPLIQIASSNLQQPHLLHVSGALQWTGALQQSANNRAVRNSQAGRPAAHVRRSTMAIVRSAHSFSGSHRLVYGLWFILLTSVPLRTPPAPFSIFFSKNVVGYDFYHRIQIHIFSN